MASSLKSIDEIKTQVHRVLLSDADILSIPDEEDEAALDEITELKNPKKDLLLSSPPNLTTDTTIPIRPWSDFSIATTSIPTKKSPSYSYKFIQLERALTSANLLKTNDDRNKFEREYRESLRENKLNEFLKKSYEKLKDYNEKLKRERAMKKSRTFSFSNLEKNFLALDPTRDIKIVFIDDPITSSTSKITNIHPNQNSALSNQSDDNAIETFYENRFQYLLRNPSRARDEITLFARQASEHLHEHLPHLSRVPHRVKIVDQREIKENNLDEYTLLQMKHKHTLSLISKRRQLIAKMMIQTKKNQNKMKQLNIQTPLTNKNNSLYCQELLERINQIEQMIKTEEIKSSQIEFNSRKIFNQTTNSSSHTTTITENLTSPCSSCSIPYQDALSIYHIEKKNNIHVIIPTRPYTAPIKKMSWINYC